MRDNTSLSEQDWNILLRRVRDGKCTPFLGAGASFGFVPTAAEVMSHWAEKYDIPLEEMDGLTDVAEYIAVMTDSLFPKEEFIESFIKTARQPSYRLPEPHATLASLPLPVYITTNYDDYMMEALRRTGKTPQLGLPRWNQRIERSARDMQPTVKNPIVFHLHGHQSNAESMVLTEGDYLTFLAGMSNLHRMIPPYLEAALASSAMLFIGYGLRDWNFLILFQSAALSMRRISLSVQLPPANDKLRLYRQRYFENLGIKMYWGTAEAFFDEFVDRWEKFNQQA